MKAKFEVRDQGTAVHIACSLLRAVDCSVRL